jgi:choline kinase
MTLQEHDVIVIAAGSSRRLAHRTQHRPKALLHAGGRPIIERSLATLHALGFRDVTIVIGYLREVFRRELGSRYDALSIHYVESPGWENAGQALSFLLARERWRTRRRPVVFVHADLVYDPRILARLMECPFPNLISVDDRFHAETNDEVLACGAPSRITRIQKIHEQPAEVLGEVISINKWSASLMDDLFAFAAERIERKGAHGDWESIVDAFLQEERAEIRPLLCGDLPWVNVNYEADLERADRLAVQLDTERERV